MSAVFFDSQSAFREWLEAHHASESEVMIGFHKKASGKGGLTYREALDEALCFGWIDGVRRSLDAESYVQRFTPRTRRSNWSNVNVKRFRELDAEGSIAPPGRAAFEAGAAQNTGVYSFEQESPEFEVEQIRTFRANPAAWAYWEKSPPGYRRIATWWVVSAKRPETRTKRLQELIDCCTRGVKIPLMRRAGDAG